MITPQSESHSVPVPLQRGWALADYAGEGIANLMSSLVLGLGREDSSISCPPLRGLPPDDVGGHRRVLLIAVDGLGDSMLAEHPGAFQGCLHRALSSVFPTTTASGITTFLTGHPPARHGLTGWHTYLQSLDTVMAVLPGRPRGSGPGYDDLALTPRELLGLDPVFDRLTVPTACVSPASITDSAFNRSLTEHARHYVYHDLAGFLSETRRAVLETPGFTYAYWPELDRLGHVHGAGSIELHTHLAMLEAGVMRLLDMLSGSDTLVLLTADHGMIDTPWRLDLHAHADIVACLRQPLCGEPRVAFAYLRPGCHERFRDLVGERFGHCLTLVESRALLDAGWFGPGPVHPEMTTRIGDCTLLMHDGWMVSDRTPEETSSARMTAVHGGLSAAERFVPLIQARVW